ncbi:B3 domain-containing transcription factor VRN1 [Vitis vinifera]|uniref:B3 domain-containing transcription factor VRN1 n=2 Tax=Vitis vinifera TaxID=29760 RepID=A0A438GF27_VITVI|nr:B3 domain-containing transcription factor VRN1 [Vitis vinifera]
MTSTQKPHFFRIIHPSFLTHGYPGIPQTFLREYGNGLSHFVFLHLPTGAEWRVELLKLHGEVLFSTGWQQFVEHYSIEYGYFLLFRYEGDSHFHVLVFDMTASEIEYPYATDPTIDHAHHQVSLEILDDFPPSQTTNHVDMIDITSSEEEFHPNEASSLLKSEEIESDFPPTQKTSKTRGKNSSLKPHNACSSHTYHSSIPDCRDGALQRAKVFKPQNPLQRAKAFKPQNPFFIVTMGWSYVNRHNVTVPFRFLKRHFRTDNTNTTLSVSDGRAWSIKYIMGARSAHFSAGWRKFAEDNSLEVGDVCAFELVKCTETSLKVVIFRKKEDGNGRLQH